jgi:hypothetical protein
MLLQLERSKDEAPKIQQSMRKEPAIPVEFRTIRGFAAPFITQASLPCITMQHNPVGQTFQPYSTSTLHDIWLMHCKHYVALTTVV